MKIQEVLVVEGTSDKQFLETFLEADFVLTNGSAIDGFDYEYLIQLAETRGIIILTDPDYPGMRIRNEIASHIPNCKHAFVRKEFSIKHHKVGVAESTKQEVIEALKNVITLNNSNILGQIKMSDLMSLHIIGECSSEKKEKLCAHFHLGKCNGKTLLKRLNMLNISLKEIERALYD